MLNLITLPFRLVRTCRFALIVFGALISGLGMWMQIEGVPPGVDPVIAVLRGLMSPVLDGQATIFGIFSKIGGVLALLGLLGMTIHDVAPAPTGDTADPAGPMAMPVPAAPAAFSAPAQSTWQERLAAKTADQSPNNAAGPARSLGSLLRVGVIGAVIFAFLAVLGATFLGNTGPGSIGSGTGNATQIAANLSPAQAMIQGHLANAGAISATAGVPSVTAFTIPKIDPAALVPWVKDQLTRALSGDQAAMMTLGSIVGGIFVLLLGIKVMFAVRREKAGQRTSTRRVSYS